MGAYRCMGQIGLTGSTTSQQQVTLVESRRDRSEMPEVLNGESIHALLVEVEAIVNSRPMTTLKWYSIITSQFIDREIQININTSWILYISRRKFIIQYVADEFCSRWHKEFLWTLLERKTCKSPKRNFQNKWKPKLIGTTGPSPA